MPKPISPGISLLAENIAAHISGLVLKLPETTTPEVNAWWVAKLRAITPPEFQFDKLIHLSIADYLKRFTKYLELEEANLISVFIYFDSFVLKNRNYLISVHNIHMLLTTIFLAENKINRDNPWELKFFATLGGMTVQQLIKAESHFCALISWDLFITESTFNFYKQRLGVPETPELVVYTSTSNAKNEALLGKENDTSHSLAATQPLKSPGANGFLSSGSGSSRGSKFKRALESSEDESSDSSLSSLSSVFKGLTFKSP